MTVTDSRLSSYSWSRHIEKDLTVVGNKYNDIELNNKCALTYHSVIIVFIMTFIRNYLNMTGIRN